MKKQSFFYNEKRVGILIRFISTAPCWSSMQLSVWFQPPCPYIYHIDSYPSEYFTDKSYLD